LDRRWFWFAKALAGTPDSSGLLQEGLGVEGSRRFVFMAEEGVELRGVGEVCEALGEGRELRCVIAAGAAKAITVEGCGGYVGCDEVIAFGDAEGCVVTAKEVVRVVGEPCGMAELEGKADVGMRDEDGGCEEGSEASEVDGEVRWKLEEEWAEFGRGVDGFDRGEEGEESGIEFG
jgi:hypothetical protein